MKLLFARAAVLLSVGAMVTVTACSVRLNATVSKEELEKQSFDALAEVTGEEPADVSCPETIDAKIGETTRCILTVDGGVRIGYTIEITSYDQGRVKMDIQVDETPLPLEPGQVGT